MTNVQFTAPGDTAYGEDQPRVADDRLPMVLVLLDGLGDRPHPELDGATPSEAARTPVLDAFTAMAQTGVHVPMGHGRAPSSEVAHWAMFGLGAVPFCGRAVLEARGQGIDLPPDAVALYAALRPSIEHDGRIWITGRTPRGDDATPAELLTDVLSQQVDGYRFDLRLLGRGEGILTIEHSEKKVAAVTDTDPFFEHLHPYAAPLGINEVGTHSNETAAALYRYLRAVREHLQSHPANRRRAAEGLPALDALTTKWAGPTKPLPTFQEVVGVPGAMIPTSAFYRGMCRSLGMAEAAPRGNGPAEQMRAALDDARALIDAGSAFVHVHTKATDLAGHTKDPTEKVAVIEALDGALAPLLSEAWTDTVVAVTGDHATPSSHGVLHTGDPTPFVIRAPWQRADEVERFGEWTCRHGALGTVRADDVMPLLTSWANRPRFLGSRPSPYPTIALPDEVTPFA